MEAKTMGGTTALFAAAGHGLTDCVRLLMDRGADRDAKSKHGSTALMVATVQGHADCVRLLLDGGANKEIKDMNGKTALDWALECGKVDVARLIRSYPGSRSDGIARMDPKMRAKFTGRSCYSCFKTQPGKLQKCGLCRAAQYCSKECQLSDWPRHKTTCDRGGALHRPASTQQCQDELMVCSAESSALHVQQHDIDDLRVNAPVPEPSVAACHFCAKSQAHAATRLKLCNRCRSVSYCSVECQRSDWGAHKKECAKPSE
jgi:hypothetical protein